MFRMLQISNPSEHSWKKETDFGGFCFHLCGRLSVTLIMYTLMAKQLISSCLYRLQLAHILKLLFDIVTLTHVVCSLELNCFEVISLVIDARLSQK